MSKTLIFFLLVLSQQRICAAPLPEDLQVPYAADNKFENKAEVHSVKFHPAGKYAATTHYLHIRLPIHMKPILESMDNFGSKIPNNRRVYPGLMKQASAAMTSTKRDLEDLLSALPENPVTPNHLKKRFLSLILGLAGVAFSV